MRDKLTAQEVADELGYHINHVYRLLRTGRMQGERLYRVWLVNPSEVERIKGQRGKGGRLPKTQRRAG